MSTANVLRLGVAGRVEDGFLADARELLLDVVRQRRGARPRTVTRTGDCRHRHALGRVVQRAHQIPRRQVRRRRRFQIDRQRFSDVASLHLPSRAHQALSRRRGRVHAVRGGFELQRDTDETPQQAPCSSRLKRTRSPSRVANC